MARKNRGRQKIEMTRMSKESNLLVTFSKRRSGLFKKASELCTLCGAEIAIVVFSPGKKAFSFGHPSVESIVERYLAPPPPPPSVATPPSTSTALQLVEAHRSASVRELNVQLNDMLGLVEEEKRRGEELTRLRKECQGGGRWWEAPIKELGVKELEQLKEAMEDLRKNVFRQAEELINAEAAAGPLRPPFLGVAPQDSRGGDGGLVGDANIPAAGLGQLSVTPHGFTLGFGRTFF